MIGGTLALDLSTVTGWAYAKPGSTPAPFSLQIAANHPTQKHLSGRVKLGDGSKDNGVRGMHFEIYLRDLFKEYKPSRVVYESPILWNGKTAIDTARILMGLAYQTEIECHRYGVGPTHCYEANLTDIRMYFIGCAPKKGKSKPLVMARCRELDWYYIDDNAADALALLDYHLYWMDKNGLLPMPEQPIDF